MKKHTKLQNKIYNILNILFIFYQKNSVNQISISTSTCYSQKKVKKRYIMFENDYIII